MAEMDLYILGDNHEVIPTDDRAEWSRRFDPIERRRVGHDQIEVGETVVEVSTVFLGLDHSLGGGVPMLFETMVFGGAHDQECTRYATWDGAAAGHAGVVREIRQAEVLRRRREQLMAATNSQSDVTMNCVCNCPPLDEDVAATMADAQYRAALGVGRRLDEAVLAPAPAAQQARRVQVSLVDPRPLRRRLLDFNS